LFVYTPEEFQRRSRAIDHALADRQEVMVSRDQRAEGARWLAQAESDLSDARYLSDPPVGR
jgi:hypothetical protein